MLFAGFSSDLMSELEHAIEISTRKAGTKGSAEDTEWQLVLDVIGQHALIFAAWSHDVLVKPSDVFSLGVTIGAPHGSLECLD